MLHSGLEFYHLDQFHGNGHKPCISTSFPGPFPLVRGGVGDGVGDGVGGVPIPSPAKGKGPGNEVALRLVSKKLLVFF